LAKLSFFLTNQKEIIRAEKGILLIGYVNNKDEKFFQFPCHSMAGGTESSKYRASAQSYFG
jgi:hypothetical protein